MEIALLDAADIPATRQFAEGWIDSAKDGFGPSIDLESCMSGVREVLERGSGDALVLVNDGEIVGLLCVEYGRPGFSLDNIAREKYFFIRPEHRGGWTRKLHKAAEELAARHLCKFIIFTISAQAGGDVHRIGRYFGLMGYQPFEQSFIKEIR